MLEITDIVGDDLGSIELADEAEEVGCYSKKEK